MWLCGYTWTWDVGTCGRVAPRTTPHTAPPMRALARCVFDCLCMFLGLLEVGKALVLLISYLCFVLRRAPRRRRPQ